jgi:hypothetical protein|tara:strand:+ start:339 stop:605 length:267 start_codon:yes stop_codon:yes gene_type:complete
MTITSKKSLATKAAYNRRPEIQARRVLQNKARRHAIKAGKASVGDGKDVHHIKMLAKGGSGKDSNTKVVDRKTNRGWRKANPGMYKKT